MIPKAHGSIFAAVPPHAQGGTMLPIAHSASGSPTNALAPCQRTKQTLQGRVNLATGQTLQENVGRKLRNSEKKRLMRPVTTEPQIGNIRRREPLPSLHDAHRVSQLRGRAPERPAPHLSLRRPCNSCGGRGETQPRELPVQGTLCHRWSHVCLHCFFGLQKPGAVEIQTLLGQMWW